MDCEEGVAHQLHLQRPMQMPLAVLAHRSYFFLPGSLLEGEILIDGRNGTSLQVLSDQSASAWVSPRQPSWLKWKQINKL